MICGFTVLSRIFGGWCGGGELTKVSSDMAATATAPAIDVRLCFGVVIAAVDAISMWGIAEIYRRRKLKIYHLGKHIF